MCRRGPPRTPRQPRGAVARRAAVGDRRARERRMDAGDRDSRTIWREKRRSPRRLTRSRPAAYPDRRLRSGTGGPYRGTDLCTMLAEMEHNPAEDLPTLYRAVLDRVGELEASGDRVMARRVRAQAIRIYSRAWDERS